NGLARTGGRAGGKVIDRFDRGGRNTRWGCAPHRASDGMAARRSRIRRNGTDMDERRWCRRNTSSCSCKQGDEAKRAADQDRAFQRKHDAVPPFCARDAARGKGEPARVSYVFAARVKFVLGF